MLRIIFMGTAELACASLRALLDSDQFRVLAAVTRPDRPQGRELKERPPPVKRMALEAGLPVLQPQSAREPGFATDLLAARPDIIVVAAYGQILPQSVLDLPRLGCINVHASLLPKYRGAAPIQWAILHGEPQTGVSIMKMTAGLDGGPVLNRRATAIGPDETAGDLHTRLAALGAQLLVETLPPYAAGTVAPQTQNEAEATYARKITKEDGRLDWTQPALAVRHRLRAMTPWPGGYTFLPSPSGPRLLKIWRARMEDRQGPAGHIVQADKSGLVVACGTGAVAIEELQLAGGRKMTATEFLAGHPMQPGLKLE
jgi:methionyl-tRNA formyltransferase